MFRSTRTLAALVIGFAALAGGSTARAQYAPMDMSGIYQMNADFDRRFYAALPGIAYRTAIATRGQQLPFNAMTISAANNDLSAQYARNNAAWANNSAASSAAVSRWTTGAINGGWGYSNGSGPAVILPYTANSYYRQNGYYYGGYAPGGNNYTPTNNFGR